MSDLMNRIDLRFDFVGEKLSNYVVSPGGCWVYQGYTDSHGYGRFKIYVNGFKPKKRNYKAHRVAYAYYNGVDPKELFVCHHCDNPSCVNPDHLFLGTAKDNTQDMISKGRKPSYPGEYAPRALLTEDLVRDIVWNIEAGKSNKVIAEELPVTHSQVSLIRLGKSWRGFTESIGYDPEKHRKFTRKAA